MLLKADAREIYSAVAIADVSNGLLVSVQLRLPLAGLGIPQMDVAIVPRRGELLAAGGIVDGPHPVGMLGEPVNLLAIGQAENPHDVIVPGCRQLVAIAMDADR